MILTLVTMASWPDGTTIVSDRSVLFWPSVMVVLILFSQVLHHFSYRKRQEQMRRQEVDDERDSCERETREMDHEINSGFEESASEGFTFIMDLIDAQIEVKAGNVATVLFWCAKTRQVVPPQILRCLANYVSRTEPEGRLEIAERLGQLKEDTTREVAMVCTALETMIGRDGEPVEASALGNAMYGLGQRSSRGRATIPRAINFLQKQSSEESVRSRTSVVSEQAVF